MSEASGIGKRFVGAIANRDLDLMADLKRFFKLYRVETIEFDPDDVTNGTFEDQLSKYDIDFIMPKLLTLKSNSRAFKGMKKLRKQLRFLNSLEAVNTCQSRRRTFALLKRRLPNLRLPKHYRNLKQISKALNQGKSILVRRDAHNIPKELRALGVAGSLDELHALIQSHQPRELFFVEHLGGHNEFYKGYVIGEKVFFLKKIGYQDGVVRTSDVREEPATVSDDIRALVFEIGRAFGMSCYGVDFLYDDAGQPIFVDVNDFPSYQGVPNAVKLICEFIHHRFLSE